MKKNIFKLATATIAAAFGLFSCGTKEEVKPTAGKPSVNVTFDAANYGVQKDFAVSATVSTTGDTAYINITADGTASMGAIYMMYQKDSEKAVKFTKQPNGSSIPSGGYIGSKTDGTEKNNFNYVGGDYTFDVPKSLEKSFKLTIPVLLRKDAISKSDVFTIWITKGKGTGRFDNPAKNLAYGVATVTLNYTNEALINYYETTLGNSANDTVSSCFATATGTNYNRENANVDAVGTSIDFIYNNYNNPSTKSNQWIFGSFYTSSKTVDTDLNSGTKNFFGAVDKITNFTQVTESTTDSWTAAVGNLTLAAEVDKVINSTTKTNKVVYPSNPEGKVFAFVTASGKKGLVKVGASRGGITSTATDTDGEIDLEVKVQR